MPVDLSNFPASGQLTKSGIVAIDGKLPHESMVPVIASLAEDGRLAHLAQKKPATFQQAMAAISPESNTHWDSDYDSPNHSLPSRRPDDDRSR